MGRLRGTASAVVLRGRRRRMARGPVVVGIVARRRRSRAGVSARSRLCGVSPETTTTTTGDDDAEEDDDADFSVVGGRAGCAGEPKLAIVAAYEGDAIEYYYAI